MGSSDGGMVDLFLVKMESHEEKLHKLVLQSKINENKDVMKRKASEIDKSKIEKNIGDKGGFGPLQSMGSGIIYIAFMSFFFVVIALFKVKAIIGGYRWIQRSVRCDSACHHKSNQKTRNTSKGDYTRREGQFL